MAKSKKGSQFERSFCKQLSLWWSWSKRDDLFWRTSQSGGRATTRMKSGLKTADSYGDITAIRKSGKTLTQNCLVELKRGYTTKKGKKNIAWIDVLNLVDTPKKVKTMPVLYDWWLKAEKQAAEAGRRSVLIVFRRDRKEACLMFSNILFNMLNNVSDRPAVFRNKHNWIITTFPKARSKYVVIVNANDFFKFYKPSKLKWVLKYFQDNC